MPYVGSPSRMRKRSVGGGGKSSFKQICFKMFSERLNSKA